MISGWGLLAVSLVYVCGLFAIAWWGDRSRLYPAHARLRPVIYSLALAVYCSSWTFYGAVGSAMRNGLSYLPIYLGPILLFVFALPFFERLVRIAKRQNATSISDLLAARFGRSPQVAAIVTVIALTAAIPYIALQLKAISMSINVLTAGTSSSASPGPWYQDSAFFVALMLALFASLFGARKIDASEHHPGMVLAIAAESVVKFVALLCVAIFAFTQLNGIEPLLATARSMPAGVDNSISFVTQTLLSLTAIFCLPRQFQIGVVECADVEDVRRARWWFPAYLALVSIVVVPIAAAAVAARVDNNAVAPDSFVLWLPLHGNQEWLALLAYLGGFSAATGMVIVASVALATMVSNDLVLPALWRWRPPAFSERSLASAPILWIRRVAILCVLLAGYTFFRLVPEAPSLASIGLLAFAAVAQFAPAVISAVYWPGASRAGVIAGLCSGFVLWVYTLLVPALAGTDHATPDWIANGPFGIALLAPQTLFGFSAPDPLTHGVFWSLLTNVAALVGMSLYSPPAIGERLQVAPTLSGASREARPARLLPGSATVADLELLATRLLGAAGARNWLQRHVSGQGRDYAPSQRADVALLQGLERDLAGALGASSARMVLTSALRGAGLQFNQVVTLLDEASQKLRFNRELLEAMMENMPQGISVVDADMRLVAWNQRYIELFQYPPELVCTGRPIADLIRYNAMRGWCGPGDPEWHVDKRLAHMRSSSPHLSERRRSDGRVIEVRGQPLPDGGFVSTFNDVTSYKHVEHELREINETLEVRVAERTRQLATVSAAAQQANQSKTRFLAAASHDLLQPLNAARLFNAALRGQAGQDAQIAQLADRVENSLHAAEELLDGLLDISRLDSGAIQPEPTEFSAGALLESLKEQFAPIAAQRGLELQVHTTRLHVHTDQRMLRRVLQNLLGNALRYTHSGRVVVGCRRRAGAAQVEFQVMDTGPGIAPESQRVIFEEFRRLDQQSPWGERGLGLGLSICDRIAHILGTRLTLISIPGRGSAFAIRVPRGVAVDGPTRAPALAPAIGGLQGLRVLCVEDDPNILDAMRELLTRWGIEIVCAANAGEASEALRARPVDLVLADYHLSGRPSGLRLLDDLVPREAGRPRAGALVTADGSGAVVQEARSLGFQILRKPLRPAALRALIVALARRQEVDSSPLPQGEVARSAGEG